MKSWTGKRWERYLKFVGDNWGKVEFNSDIHFLKYLNYHEVIE